MLRSFCQLTMLSAITLMLTVIPLPTPAYSMAPADFGSGLQICTPPVQPVTLVNPTVITNCTNQGIQTALNQGGYITFSCGAGPVTIPINTMLNTQGNDIVLDGQGLITLDGQNSTKILSNPFVASGNTLVIQNMRFINGRSPASGGLGPESGAAITSGSPGTQLHVINSTFENNHTTNTTSADNQGGAIFSSNSYETIISGSVFRDNSAGNGGAIGGLATGMLIYNSTFSDNQAVDTTNGGIVRGYGGVLHLDGVTNDYNPDSNKTFHICGSIFEDNTSVRGGGALASVVSDNFGTKAFYERSTFINNEVSGIPDPNNAGQYLYGQGGAIYHVEDDRVGADSEDNFEINQSTFTGNKARRQGGAIWVTILGLGRVVNSTIEGNTTTAPFNTVGQGGGMALGGTFDIVNTIFANNHASYQGGAMHGGGTGNNITLKNTIFYNNTLNEQDLPSETRWQGYHTNRPMNDGGQNIQYPRFKPTYNNDVNNNITATPIYQDPLLSPLADNGGFNQTMALQAGSPAIDSGAVGCPAVDQRDAERMGPCDIGAYEFGGGLPSLVLTKRVADLSGGDVPFGEAVAYTIALQNASLTPATGLVMTDTLPAGLTFGGWQQPNSATWDGTTIAWGPGGLGAGQAVMVVFTATVDQVGGNPPISQTIVNTAYFSSTNLTVGSGDATFTVGVAQRLLYLPLARK